MQYEIKIETQELINDLRFKNRLEAANIENADQRYRAEMGTDKTVELTKCIQYADSCVRTLLSDYLMDEEMPPETYNEYNLPVVLVYRLDLSDRRSYCKGVPMTETIHSYLVNMTLAKCYASLGHGALAEQNGKAAEGDAQMMLSLINKKKIPSFI